MKRNAQSGVTLVEVLVALVIFALIGVAGFAMLDQVLRTERLTEGRLDRLGQMSRAMYLISQDFGRADGASLQFAEGRVALRRAASGMKNGSVTLVYEAGEGRLMRHVTDSAGSGIADQIMLPGVDALVWQFYADGQGWLSDWPPEDQGADLTGRSENPRAVALTVKLAGTGQSLRRVALLPAEVP